jgi:hypothetical protein
MADPIADLNAVLTTCGIANADDRQGIINEGFNSIDDLSARQQVDTLLAGIRTDDGELKGAKAVIRHDYASDFDGACAYFSGVVSELHGDAQLEYSRHKNKKRGIYAVDRYPHGRGGRGRGRFGPRSHGRGYQGRGGRGGGRGSGGSRNMMNGVDVSYVFRNFSRDEWERLGRDGRDYILQQRERLDRTNGNNRNPQAGQNNSNRNVGAAEITGHLYGGGAFQFFQHAVENIDTDPLACTHGITGYLFTQMSAAAGIKKHGQVAIDALFKEFAQLHDKNVFEAMDASSLTEKQKKQALRAINVIKEKRCRRIKGRTCADGRPQRSLYRKDETTSPTVSTDALLISIMIDALEQRDVATADIVGAYLNADMDDFVLLRLTGSAVDILCSVSPGYKAFVTREGNTKVLYVRLAKALYGCVKSALLWYELFVGTLKEHGFELNPYDPCVANCTIRGKQCTIAWFVDDNKISHVDPEVVDEIIRIIESKFGKMTVTRGKRHTFLGMDITYGEDGTATILMKDYIREAISDFGDDVSSKAASPAGRGLFDVDEDSPDLDSDKREIFHSITAKLLYVSQRARSDIAPTITFLCTRVSCSTQQDWLKLRRLLQYLNDSIHEPCILGADNLSSLMTWVDASYAVHSDMKSHTGGALSLGCGAIMCKSTKQKLNTKSSTEAETVGASDYLPNTIWARMFLEAQGYGITNNIFAQDNESAIRLEKNGRASAGQKSRHIDIRHFFITDRIKSERLTIVHCPTVEMLADFFTKLLQGALFRKFRAIILGHEPIEALQDSLDKYRDTAPLPQDVPSGASCPSSLSATPTGILRRISGIGIFRKKI